MTLWVLGARCVVTISSVLSSMVVIVRSSEITYIDCIAVSRKYFYTAAATLRPQLPL